MDASTHANRKGEEKQRKENKGEKQQGGDKGRYEGGRDSDQNRQAQGREQREQRDEDKPATSEPDQPAEKGRGTEEE